MALKWLRFIQDCFRIRGGGSAHNPVWLLRAVTDTNKGCFRKDSLAQRKKAQSITVKMAWQAEVLAACSLLGRSKSRGRGCLSSAGFQPVYSVGNPSLWNAVLHIQSIPDPSIILEETSWLHPKMCLINALGTSGDQN